MSRQMEGIDSSPLMPISPNSRKRAAPHHTTDDGPDHDTRPINLKGTQFVMPTPPDTEGSSNASPDGNANNERAASPTPSSISTLSSSIMVSATEPVPSTAPTRTHLPPAKKRKLSPTEQLEKKREKEEKVRQKNDEKTKKDEEKRRKAEEREGKKREKDLEEERKAQEILKKERSQMRLGAFFQKPATPVNALAINGEARRGNLRRKSLSLEPFDAIADHLRRSASPLKGTPSKLNPAESVITPAPAKPTVSDYKKHFLPFVPPSHSSVASDFGISNPDDLAYWQGMFDGELLDPTFREKVDLGIVQPAALFDHLFASKTLRGTSLPNIRALVDLIQGTSQQPVDLTGDTAMHNPMEALRAVSRRYLHFHLDVRPPWFGSYTKIRSPTKTKKLSRNPFTRARTDTDYDYDSEAEWDEPEEGEDIDLEEDDEAESVADADEMDGFLDDEDDAVKNKRKMITGDLQPTSTGLCWEDDGAKSMSSIEGEQSREIMPGMGVGFLIPGFIGKTIDPFCTTYWTNHMDPPGPRVVDLASKTLGGLLTCSRPPLADRANLAGMPPHDLIGAAQGMKGPINSVSATQGAKRGRKPQPKTLGPEDMDDFKEAVVGSQLGKLELQKGLKLRYDAMVLEHASNISLTFHLDRFPKITHEVIKDTLGSQFAQVGNAKAEKKWVYIEPQ